MVRRLSQLVTLGKLFGIKLMLGGVALVAVMVVGTSGAAAAQQLTDTDASGLNNVSMCQNQQDLKKYNFSSSKACVNWWNHNHGGNGYGNGHHHHHKHHRRHHWFSWWDDLFHHKH